MPNFFSIERKKYPYESDHSTITTRIIISQKKSNHSSSSSFFSLSSIPFKKPYQNFWKQKTKTFLFCKYKSHFFHFLVYLSIFFVLNLSFFSFFLTLFLSPHTHTHTYKIIYLFVFDKTTMQKKKFCDFLFLSWIFFSMNFFLLFLSQPKKKIPRSPQIKSNDNGINKKINCKAKMV